MSLLRLLAGACCQSTQVSAKLPANQLKATKRTTPGQERKQVFDVVLWSTTRTMQNYAVPTLFMQPSRARRKRNKANAWHGLEKPMHPSSQQKMCTGHCKFIPLQHLLHHSNLMELTSMFGLVNSTSHAPDLASFRHLEASTNAGRHSLVLPRPCG